LDADVALETAMAGVIEVAATRYAVDPGSRWAPGQPYKLLLAGYTGTRNTGADVRVEEMIRQFRHLWGDEHLELSILTIDREGSRGYFRTARQLEFPKIFPAWLGQAVREHHGVIACEGSMFKSKFANALATMMTGALGLAAAEGKVAVGYGGEAGAMDPHLERLVERYCRDTLQICRNDASADVLRKLGIPCRIGTDTAWTYQPAGVDAARARLREAGWDGQKPVVVVSPINAFWWPVRADVRKLIEKAATGAHKDTHYASVYFHHAGPEVDRKQSAYLRAWADAVEGFRSRHDCFVVLYGSEALDRRACEALRPLLSGDVPLYCSDTLDHGDMVGLLWASSLVLSSRYHALVCSMAGGPVSVGVTMDERIRNLMADRGTPELALECSDPDLGEKLEVALERAWAERDALADGIARCVVRNLRIMGSMGQILVDTVRERHPDMPLRPELGEHGDPWDHLPPLPPRVRQLADTYA
jgi:polysaccharide pyruvyl transferase WcaK-like protein